MKTLKQKLALKVLQIILRKVKAKRSPDFVVDVGYMDRWYIIPRNRFFNIYFHYFTGSDAPTMHDHPWFSAGWILNGQYTEHTPKGDFVRKSGDITVRAPWSLHWIEIDKPVYTLFITGPRIRRWGFLCRKQIPLEPFGFMIREEWIDHEDYIKRRGEDRLANGCGEGAL